MGVRALGAAHGHNAPPEQRSHIRVGSTCTEPQLFLKNTHSVTPHAPPRNSPAACTHPPSGGSKPAPGGSAGASGSRGPSPKGGDSRRGSTMAGGPGTEGWCACACTRRHTCVGTCDQCDDGQEAACAHVSRFTQHERPLPPCIVSIRTGRGSGRRRRRWLCRRRRWRRRH